MKVDLLKHNQEAYEKITEAIADGKKKIAIAHATGTGKSYLVAKLFEDYSNDKKLVLVPSRYIKEQMQGLFEKYDIGNADIILYQKLIKMSDEDIAGMDYGVIALDEYHHDAATKVWGEKVRLLIDSHEESIIFGSSATPVRTDGVNTIDELFEGNCASDLPLSESIAKKIVPLPKYVGVLYKLDDELERLRKKVEQATNTKEEKFEFYKKIDLLRSQIEKSYGMPIILNKHIKDKEGKYIVFCKNKKHLDEIKDTVIGWFHTAGFKDIHSYVVHSSYEGKDKEYKAFCDDKSHTLKLLFCVDMLNEGLHLENISGVLLLRPTNSSIVWHQQIGRAIEANNASTPVIIDAVNNFSAVGQGMELLREIKEAVAREKESDPEFDDSGFEDIDTFFVLEQVLDIQDMFKEIEGRLKWREWTEEEIDILKKYYLIEGTKVSERLKGRTKLAVKRQARILGLNINICKPWTKNEIGILKKWYPIEGLKVVSRLEGRTKSAILSKAIKLSIQSPDRDWADHEIEILKEYYPIEGIKVKDRLDGRTESSIFRKVSKLKIQIPTKWIDEEYQILYKYYPTEGGKVKERLNNKTKHAIYIMASRLGIKISDKSWTEEEIEILKKWYPIEGTKVIDKLSGRTKGAIATQASKLGLEYRNGKKYKYVYSEKNRYVVMFSVNGKNMRFGTFDSEEEAAKVAMEKAKEYGKAV